MAPFYCSMEGITFTLTWTMLAAMAYVVVAVMVSFAATIEEMSFKNPNYVKCILVGALWPWLVIQLVYVKATDRYLVKDVRDLKESWDQYRCDHTDTESVD